MCLGAKDAAMLRQNLCTLERGGTVPRVAYPVVPPKVACDLTPVSGMVIDLLVAIDVCGEALMS